VSQAAGPLVSIVLTTLNAATYLRECLDSCLLQTYSHFELIVVDGGSSDETLEILATYSDPRMRLVHQRGNSGKLPGALNLGLAEARGEYLTWMQADSRYDPSAIETMQRCLQQQPDQVGQVYADFWHIDASGATTGIQVMPEPEEFLTSSGDPAGVCFLLRRAVRETIGRHNESSFPIQDAEYRWRIARRFDSVHLHQPLYYWRLHPNSLSGSRPWVIDVRLGIPIRLHMGLLTPRQARAELGKLDIAYAFDRYANGCLTDVPALVLSGLRRDPRFMCNRGVWSILLKSLANAAVTRQGLHGYA
jgi:glycosyltransferase involved in cell wall biosynthesis